MNDISMSAACICFQFDWFILCVLRPVDFCFRFTKINLTRSRLSYYICTLLKTVVQ